MAERYEHAVQGCIRIGAQSADLVDSWVGSRELDTGDELGESKRERSDPEQRGSDGLCSCYADGGGYGAGFSINLSSNGRDKGGEYKMGVGHKLGGAYHARHDKQWTGGCDGGGTGDEYEPRPVFRGRVDERDAAGKCDWDRLICGYGVWGRDGAGPRDCTGSSGQGNRVRGDVVDV